MTSIPGAAVRASSRRLAVVGDASAFPATAHLASQAGLLAALRRPGASIWCEGPPRNDNGILERAMSWPRSPH
ncbi:hypothetical protein ACFRIB_32575 [Streptomyces mirabilis]|uniref:hypothetical protein n=1 Tax=Streptomyces mirabilis TaxID=68239 RepID=UPI0036785BA2